jgi:dihydrofolate synthase/folylpolyglutamate synthase
VTLPAASLLTPIELEHTEELGETITAIAGEKAGIIKQGVPVFVSPQTDEAFAVFRKAAAGKGCRLYYLPECFKEIRCRADADNSYAELVLNGQEKPFSLHLRLRGEVQAENAALAFLTLRTVIPQIPVERVITGLEEAFIPGRFQKLEDSPPVFVDGSHTPLSVTRLLHSFRELYPKPDTLILGVVGGKRHEEIAEILCPAFRSVIVTTPGTFKTSDPRQLFEICKKFNPSSRLIPSPATALAAAQEGLPDRGCPILITGSFYLAGEILKHSLPVSR